MLHIEVKMWLVSAVIVATVPGAKGAPPVCLPNCVLTGRFVNGTKSKCLVFIVIKIYPAFYCRKHLKIGLSAMIRPTYILTKCYFDANI